MTKPDEMKIAGLSANNRKHLLDCVLLTLAALLVYGRLVGADFQASWDDNVYILNNGVVHGFSWEHIRSAFCIGTGNIGQYNPLALLSFMLDYTFWGLNPGGYHLTNIIIHLLNGLLVYRLITKLHGDRLVSLAAAALFLLHPVQVESVAWISERKGLLSLFFMLIAWERYLVYRAAATDKRGLAYGLSLLCFLLSLLAKTASVVLPVILLSYDWCFASKDKRVFFRDKVPFVVVAVIFAAIEIYAEQPDKGGSLAGYHGGSPLATFFTMLPVFCRYLRLLVWPAGLNIEHWPSVHRAFDLEVAGAILLLAVIFAAGVFLFRRERRLGFWFLFFWVGLLPVSQIVPLFLLMYEHYLYLPIIGFAALAGSGVAFVRSRVPYPLVITVLLAFWIAALSEVSFQRTAVWRNSLSLFTDSATKSPGAFRVWWVLGGIYRLSGDFPAAQRSYEKSLELNPKSTDVLWELGNMHAERGEFDKGFHYLDRLHAINPTYVKGWDTHGDIHRDRREYAEAEEAYLRVMELQPDAVEVDVSLAALYRLWGRLNQARFFYDQAEQHGGNDPINAYRMACVAAMDGREADALKCLEKALQRGYRDYHELATTPELSKLWQSSRFNYLLLQYFPEMEAVR